jgi:predicted nucleotidyltransferase
MLTRSSAIDLARRFVQELGKAGIPVIESYLFGSFAKGGQENDSDVDVALVSERFEGVRFTDREKLVPFLVKYIELEPHPFRPEDFNESSPFAREIIRTGIRLV